MLSFKEKFLVTDIRPSWPTEGYVFQAEGPSSSVQITPHWLGVNRMTEKLISEAQDALQHYTTKVFYKAWLNALTEGIFHQVNWTE